MIFLTYNQLTCEQVRVLFECVWGEVSEGVGGAENDNDIMS